jgi:hypothetical protein
MHAVLDGGPRDTTANLIKSDDLEKGPITPVLEKLDIEHAAAQDDPRNWSQHRKACISIYAALILTK